MPGASRPMPFALDLTTEELREKNKTAARKKLTIVDERFSPGGHSRAFEIRAVAAVLI